MQSLDADALKPPAAWARMIADHQGRLRAYIASLVIDRQATDDVLQETNLILFRKADEFEPDSNFKAWAFRIAYLETMRWRRTARRDRLVFDQDLIDQLEARADAEDAFYVERRKRLRTCLQKLPALQRRIVFERYFRSRSVNEIADEDARSANATSKLLCRARKALEDCIAGAELAEAADE